jgi:hypothetical protein
LAFGLESSLDGVLENGRDVICVEECQNPLLMLAHFSRIIP